MGSNAVFPGGKCTVICHCHLSKTTCCIEDICLLICLFLLAYILKSIWLHIQPNTVISVVGSVNQILLLGRCLGKVVDVTKYDSDVTSYLYSCWPNLPRAAYVMSFG